MPGRARAAHNDGEEPLLMLVAGRRLPLEICDYPHRQLRLYARGGEHDLVAHQHIGHHARAPFKND